MSAASASLVSGPVATIDDAVAGMRGHFLAPHFDERLGGDGAR